MPAKHRLMVEATAAEQFDRLPTRTKHLVWLALDVLETQPNASFDFVYELTGPYAGTKVFQGPGFELYWRVEKDTQGDYAVVPKIEQTDYFSNPGGYMMMELVLLLEHARYNIALHGYFLTRSIRAIRFRGPKSFRRWKRRRQS